MRGSGLYERARRPASALFVGLLLSACNALPPVPAIESVELAHVPAFEQQALQCGPAALASVLNASGVPVTPEVLTPDLFIPARDGSLPVELMAQARQRRRVPLRLEPDETALIAALQAGQPILVLLNLGLRSAPTWHYAAVVGFDPGQGYLLNNGRLDPERVSRPRFLRRWNYAERWAITLHAADQPPAHASAARWIAAAAGFEGSHPALAESAYRAAMQRWPESALPWAALGTLRFAAKDHEGAVQALRTAAELAPVDPAIANNLASVELARGCVRAAAQALGGFEPQQAPAAVAAAMRETLAEIAEASGKSGLGVDTAKNAAENAKPNTDRSVDHCVDSK